MNVLSVFDGPSTAKLASQRAGLPVSNYFSSEIDKYAIQVSKRNYSKDVIQLGDIKSVRQSSLPEIDLLIGGSPCQGFSFAGKGLNFNDERSKLFFEYTRLLDECKPKYFLLENVVMKKEYQDIITKYLGVEPVMINSDLVSAQNRKRLYWTNIDFEIPEGRGILWGDVRQNVVEELSFYYSPKALRWIGRHGTRKNKVLKVHSNNEKMQMVEATHYKKYSSQRFFGIVDNPNFINTRYNKSEIQEALNRYQGVLPDLEKGEYLRYITVVECERLQNLPDGYTFGVSYTQRYKMIDNGFTVDIISEILKGIKQYG